MKKLLLSILSICSFTAFSQWAQVTALGLSGHDCYSAFGKAFASDAGSNTLNASTDDGATWSLSNTGISSFSVGVKFGALNAGTLYAFRNTEVYQSTTGNGWTANNTSAMNSSAEVIKGIAVSSGSVFAMTVPISGSGIKIYQLSGTTWNFKANVPIATANLGNCIEDMNGELWIGTTATLSIRSTNGGTTWAACNGTLSPTNWWDKFVLCQGATSTTLFMGTYGGRLFKSTNNGSTWSTIYNISNGATISISDIFVRSNNDILVACDSGFVYSNDGGATFQKNNLGLNYSNSEYLLRKITIAGSYIIASTANGAIVRRPLNQIFSGINEIDPLVVESKVYPNPATSFATIEATGLVLEKDCNVKVTDVLGRTVSAGEMKNGKAEINLSNFSSGVYTYCIYNDHTAVSKGKLVVQ